MLQQQVNLYQPQFRRERRIFSASTLLEAVGMFAALLAGVYAFGYREVRQLEAELVRLEGHEKAFAAQLARLDPATIEGRRELDDELARLNAELIEQQRLIEILEQQPLGSTEGFSAQLEALARQHGDGLWLTRVGMDGASARMELAGVSLQPELVPEYLQRLGSEPALAGQRFDVLAIERVEGEQRVSFRVSSRQLEQAFARSTP
jgi:DNA-binding transcriptional regulator YbjK